VEHEFERTEAIENALELTVLTYITSCVMRFDVIGPKTEPDLVRAMIEVAGGDMVPFPSQSLHEPATDRSRSARLLSMTTMGGSSTAAQPRGDLACPHLRGQRH
jgi:hypothetical protein